MFLLDLAGLSHDDVELKPKSEFRPSPRGQLILNLDWFSRTPNVGYRIESMDETY